MYFFYFRPRILTILIVGQDPHRPVFTVAMYWYLWPIDRDRWDRLLADRFFAALSEAIEAVYATIA
jgi:hypothetical protein